MHNEPDFASETPAVAGLKNPLQGLANVLAAIGTVWIFLMMLLIVADVLGRNFFDAPITGVAEFAARSVASIVFLQLAAAICSGRMTRSDFLLRIIDKRSPRAVKVLEVLNVLVGALLFFALAAISWPELTAAVKIKEYFGVQGVFTVVTWPFRALIVLGSVAAALAYLACIPSLLRQPPSTGAYA
ncbi:TRAP transporter small permease subunit [Polaromonas sp.]|uniref:TRAP transporter small permease subunit n=1 Tax=Polaromonas sp. TaxID=1869339 RepID=UPI003752AB6C